MSSVETGSLDAPTVRTVRSNRVHSILANASKVRLAGVIILGIQLLVLLGWGWMLVSRFSLTYDFGTYYQGWWLIGHGVLDPYSTVNHLPFWTNNSEWYMWPLGVLALVFPHPFTLVAVECIAVVAAEWLVFDLGCRIAFAPSSNVSRPTDALEGGERSDAQDAWPGALALLGMALLVVDPWIYWSVGFEFHSEPIGICFALLAARQLYVDPRSWHVWVWVAAAMSCGAATASYAVALGAGAALADRKSRRAGLIILAIGAAYLVLLSLIGGTGGTGLSNFAYLATGAAAASANQIDIPQLVTGLLRHPGQVGSVLWQRRLDVYAAVAPGGFIGVLSPWIIVAAVLVIFEGILDANASFAAPSYQDLFLYVLLPVGAVCVLAKLGRSHRRAATVVAVLLAANAVGWAVVWLPRTSSQWIRVSPQAAATLASAQGRIPTGDEVIASQGVVGAFSGRRWAYMINGPGRIAVHTRKVFVVITPQQGIELASVSVEDALISELSGPLHAHLLASGAGVWVFDWTPGPGVHSLVVPAAPVTIGAWTSAGEAGMVDKTGPEADWRAVSKGSAGYVVSGDYWPVRPGQYIATVTLSSTVPVNVEVWNDTGGVLLARRSVPTTDGIEAVTLSVDAIRVFPSSVFGGEGLFQMLPASPRSDNSLEIRVWSPGGGLVSVASLEMRRVGGDSAD